MNKENWVSDFAFHELSDCNAAKDYEYQMSYNFVHSGSVVTTVTAMGLIIIGGVVAVVLAPTSGGSSIAVPLVYFAANCCVA